MRGKKLERTGIEVRYATNGVFNRGEWQEEFPARGPGWYVYVMSSKGFHAIMDFRYVREKDARLSAKSLEKEGLDNVRKLKEAGWNRVSQVMMEALQW